MAGDKKELDALIDKLTRARNENGSTSPRSWCPEGRERVVSIYSAIVSLMPFLEGYWVSLARLHFESGDTQKALAVYEKATGAAPYCIDLWIHRLEFMILVNVEVEFIESAFQQAESFVGLHFFAHKLFDLWGDWLARDGNRKERAVLFAKKLQNCTLYGYADYCKILASDAADPAIAELLQTQFKISGPVASWIRSQASLHQQRVDHAWLYEKEIKRQVFYPVSLPVPQVKAWQRYVDAAQSEADRCGLYRRAVVVAAQNESLWLSYVRWAIAADMPDVHEIFALGSSVLPNSCLQFRKLWALYLEWRPISSGDLSNLSIERNISPATIWHEIIDNLLLYGPNTSDLATEYTAWLRRNKPDRGLSELETRLGQNLPEDIKVTFITALARLKEGVFEQYVIYGSKKYWRARFKHSQPAIYEQLYLEAEPGSVDDLYLEHLLKTDAKLYIDLFNSLYPSALETKQLGILMRP